MHALATGVDALGSTGDDPALVVFVEGDEQRILGREVLTILTGDHRVAQETELEVGRLPSHDIDGIDDLTGDGGATVIPDREHLCQHVAEFPQIQGTVAVDVVGVETTHGGGVVLHDEVTGHEGAHLRQVAIVEGTDPTAEDVLHVRLISSGVASGVDAGGGAGGGEGSVDGCHLVPGQVGSSADLDLVTLTQLQRFAEHELVDVVAAVFADVHDPRLCPEARRRRQTQGVHVQGLIGGHPDGGGDVHVGSGRRRGERHLWRGLVDVLGHGEGAGGRLLQGVAIDVTDRRVAGVFTGDGDGVGLPRSKSRAVVQIEGGGQPIGGHGPVTVHGRLDGNAVLDAVPVHGHGKGDLDGGIDR